jgi:hypothetical protein
MRAETRIVERLVSDLREPLHTLASLADLLDLRASAHDASLRMQTTGFRDAIHHIDWLLSEAHFYTQPIAVNPVTLNVSALLDAGASEVGPQLQAPLRIDSPVTPETCVLYADDQLLRRFFKSVLHMADQLAQPDQAVVLRTGNSALHGQPAILLEIEASTVHAVASDFADLENSERNTPLAGFSFAIANCRRILEAHAAAIEFADLRDGRLRLRAFFPVLTPEQWVRVIP